MIDAEIYETTEEQYEIFKKAVWDYQVKFGLLEWKVFTRHIDLEGVRANCSWDTTDGKMCTISLGTKWNNVWGFPTDQQVRCSALHEVMHLLFADAYDVAMHHDLSYSQRELLFDRALHGVIRRIENSMMELWMLTS